MAMGHGVVEGVLGALQGNVIPIGDRCPDAIAATAKLMEPSTLKAKLGISRQTILVYGSECDIK